MLIRGNALSIFILVLFFIPGCTGPKHFYKNPALVTKIVSQAFYEDSVVSYQLMFTKKQHFFYTIIDSSHTHVAPKTYYGKYSYKTDTLFLKYQKRRPPTAITRYLVVEASGNYLIQPFSQTNKRVFLLLQHLNHGFSNFRY